MTTPPSRHGSSTNLNSSLYPRTLTPHGHPNLNPVTIAEEIDLLRLTIRSLFEQFHNTTDPCLTLSLLFSISAAANSLADLVLLQHKSNL